MRELLVRRWERDRGLWWRIYEMSIGKVLVIGLDGATFNVIKPLLKQGKLPTIAKLMDEGVYGELRSVTPPISPTAWASFATGMNPGKHGIFGFTSPKGGIPSINSAKIGTLPLWEILSIHNKRVCVISVPFTYPPKEINGVIVTGMGTPDEKSDFVFPKELKKKLIKFGYKPDFDRKCLDSEELFDEEIGGLLEGVWQTSKYLIKELDWGFFMVVFGATDTVQHIFWKYLDEKHPQYEKRKVNKYGNKIYEYYQKIDKVISKLIGMVDNNTYIIIMSDHGGGPVYKRVSLNKWLENEGLLKLKTDAKRKSFFSSVQHLLVMIGLNRENLVKIADILGLKDFLSKIMRLIKVDSKFILKFIPSRLHDFFESIDWKQTVAYAKDSYGNIYLNVDKSDKQYGEIREKIIEKIYNLVDPESGQKVVSKVFKRENLFWGPFVNSAPDIYAAPEPGYEIIGYTLGNSIFLPPFRSGTHTEDGIFICKGPYIKRGHKIDGLKIIDLAPTILYIFGLPIPKDMDGKVLKEIFEDESNLAKRSIIYQDERNEIKAKIKKLRRLGKI